MSESLRCIEDELVDDTLQVRGNREKQSSETANGGSELLPPPHFKSQNFPKKMVDQDIFNLVTGRIILLLD